MRSIWISGAWSDHCSATRAQYIERAVEASRTAAPGLSQQELLRGPGPLISFASPPMWQWLRDTFGLTGEEVERASSWAMSALLSATRRAPQRQATPRRGGARKASRNRTS